ncbi:hypothetical protein [Metabacillus sp. 84]|uniref:hypothetical protein n=1 Tax=unclassified Metabacillus TaxID=2675274 RepID=UPI003CF76452
MELRDYEVLPDLISVDKLECMYEEVLEEFNLGKMGKVNFLKILNELTDQQVSSM